GQSNLDIRLTPNTISGVITSSDGKPVGGALVLVGSAQATSGADGSYQLRDLTPGPKGYDLVIKAPGYRAGRKHLDQTGPQNITLEPFTAKAIYVSASTVADQARFAGILQLADRSEINAVVIEVKKDTDGYVLYDSKLPDV